MEFVSEVTQLKRYITILTIVAFTFDCQVHTRYACNVSFVCNREHKIYERYSPKP